MSAAWAIGSGKRLITAFSKREAETLIENSPAQ